MVAQASHPPAAVPDIQLVKKVTPSAVVASSTIPYSADVEESVIGAILANPTQFYSIALRLEPDDFFIMSHRHVWNAMAALIKRNEPIDPITLTQQLKNDGQFEAVGGAAYITKLLNVELNSLHGRVYAQLVERLAGRRRVLEALNKGMELAKDMRVTYEQMAQDVNALVVRAVGRTFRSEMETLSESMKAIFGEVSDRQEGLTTAPMVPTGIAAYDKTIGGLPKGLVTVLAAASGIGKTIWALNIALNAMRLGLRVALFPLEMGRKRTILLIMAIEAGIDPEKIMSGTMTPAEWGRFVEVSARLNTIGEKMFIYDRPLDPDFRMSPARLMATCNALAVENGVDLVIVDYLTLMESGKQFKNPYEEYSYVSRTMPIMAGRLGVPLLMLAQIPLKKLQGRKDKRPQPGDVEYVGEKDADVVVGLHREWRFDPTADPADGELVVLKNRVTKFLHTLPLRFDNYKFKG